MKTKPCLVTAEGGTARRFEVIEEQDGVLIALRPQDVSKVFGAFPPRLELLRDCLVGIDTRQGYFIDQETLSGLLSRSSSLLLRVIA